MTTDKKLFIALAILMVSIFLTELSEAQVSKESRAKPQSSAIYISPLGVDLRLERNNEQSSTLKSYMNLALGYKYQRYDLSLERNSFSETSGNSTSSVARDYSDISIWGKYSFYRLRLGDLRFSLLAGAGIGSYQEEITTRYMGSDRTDKSQAKLLGGISAGTETQYLIGANLGLMLSAEGRAQFAQSFDPNPVLSILCRLGFLYRF